MDGPEHYESRERIKYDEDRTNHLQMFGIKIIRFKDEEVLTNNEFIFDKDY